MLSELKNPKILLLNFISQTGFTIDLVIVNWEIYIHIRNSYSFVSLTPGLRNWSIAFNLW